MYRGVTQKSIGRCGVKAAEPLIFQTKLLVMTRERTLVYAYLELPYHQRVELWRKMEWYGWVTSDDDQQTRNREFFQWVKANNKVDELEILLR